MTKDEALAWLAAWEGPGSCPELAEDAVRDMARALRAVLTAEVPSGKRCMPYTADHQWAYSEGLRDTQQAALTALGGE